MPSARPPGRELGFLLADTARLLRTYTDQRARSFGSTRAQWSVLYRLQRRQGMAQGELAALLDVQPITLARLVDRLCEDGLVERRPDDKDRRMKRLFLTAKGEATLESLDPVAAELLAAATQGLSPEAVAALAAHLIHIKGNLKALLGAPDEQS